MRESGILMHITSLPAPYGIGTMGKDAYAFVDFLVRAGQRYWQILPLTPTGYGDSPYQSLGACAGNHYLIDLDRLADEGLLKREEIQNIPSRVGVRSVQLRITASCAAYRDKSFVLNIENFGEISARSLKLI